MIKRIENKFTELSNRQAKIAFFNAGDPNYETSLEIIKKLPESGVDFIEIGMPFLDPAGDGPIIETSSKRAISNGINLNKILNLVKEFRQTNQTTPIVLMGYFNPIFKYGVEKFIQNAKNAQVDGLLIVDLPPEEDGLVMPHAQKHDIDIIKLITPNSTEDRIKKIIQSASGFLYLVSVLGITGTKKSNIEESKKQITKIRQFSNLPIAVGFGIKEKSQIAELENSGAEAVVVGSKFVKIIEENLEKTSNDLVEKTISEVKSLFCEI
jgi:tryptophan synthase alpha chain